MDMFLDSEQAVGNLTIAKLNAMIKGGDGGAWSIDDGDPDTDLQITAAGQLSALRNSISIGGTPYTGAGSAGIEVSWATDVSSAARYAFAVGRDNVLAGFFFKANIEVDFAGLDFLNMEGTTGATYCVFAARNNGGSPFFYVHTQAGVGPTFNFVNDELYWVQLRYGRNVSGDLAVWRVSDWSLIGTSTLGMTNEACARIKLAHIESHGAAQPSTSKTDNYIFKYTGVVPAANVLMV
jgi:hypothetical protein